MSKAFLLPIVFLLLKSSFSFSQSNLYHPFPDTANYFWGVKYLHHDGSCMCVLDFSYVDVLGDTMTMNGMVYRKITDSQNYLIRQNIPEKKVFARRYGIFSGLDTLEYLLYDFGLAIGDSVNLRLKAPTEMGPHYRFLTCTAIDSVWTSTGYRKRLKMEFSHPPYWSQFTDQNHDYWVEGIGSTFNVLREVPDCFEFECFIQLSCFGSFDISGDTPPNLIYGENCDFITRIEKQAPQSNLMVYQEGKRIRIELPAGVDQSKIITSELVDLYGRSIQQLDYDGETYIENNFSGIYIVMIRTSSGLLSKKVLLMNN